MKNNNGGFTLVELLVSVAIFAVVAAAATTFLVTGSRSYSSIYSISGLQVDAQTAMNQLENYIIDCNGGIYYNSVNNTLYIVDTTEADDGTVTYVQHAFSLDASNQIISYAKSSLSRSSDTVTETKVESESGLMTRYVTYFSVDLISDSTGAVSSAAVTLSFARRGKTYTGSETVALRNLPVTAASLDDLYADVLGQPKP